jgi:transposase
MERREKVELFEQMRREYEFGGQSIRALASRFGVHRRLVRQALACAVPPERKRPVRSRPKLELARAFIDEILEADRHAPRKQRHTAHRIHQRLKQELPEVEIAERTVRQYVQGRKMQLGLDEREVAVPQEYVWGSQGQVDWYTAVVEIAGERQQVQVFTMRSMASGAAFHRAYPRATQQAFLEAHEYAFQYFGGVFVHLRYDNLKSAVKRILRGSRREETERFIAFRSHWQYQSSFCTPGKGQEKGGVEGEVGRFRRNHLVPIPTVADWTDLNALLEAACRRDQSRHIDGHTDTVGVAMRLEQPHLLPLQEGFELAEESFARVDGKGCVQARTNFYSTPLRVGVRCRVRVLPATVEVWHDGRRVAVHERCYSRRQQVLELEHYLDVLAHKPGALSGSRPLAQWRAAGRWTPVYDELWQRLQQRHGQQAGTRVMIEVLQLGRESGYDQLTRAIGQAITLGTQDAAAVRYLLHSRQWEEAVNGVDGVNGAVEAVEVAARQLVLRDLVLSETAAQHFERPLPPMDNYDLLLSETSVLSSNSVPHNPDIQKARLGGRSEVLV